jgi:tRNA threonylcarbamoyladenosine biosynthesis protein TsaE
MTETAVVFADGEEAMVALGEQIGRALSVPLVVYLSGELGMGKTTLARGILRAFGHRGAVKSPTYTLVEPYDLGDRQLYHFDLYRLGDPEELEFMGIRDYFNDTSIALVEWPDRGGGFLPPADLSIRIEKRGNGRILHFEAGDEAGVECIRKLPIELFDTGESGAQ